MAKVVYLLGAGASYNSVPIINKSEGRRNFGEYFHRVLSDLDKRLSVESFEYIKSPHKEIIRELMVKYSDVSEEYTTPDTFAKSLTFKYPKNHSVHKDFKIVLSIFFMYWNFVRNKVYNSDFTFIEKRYISWLAYLLDNSRGITKINPNVLILSWNYDNEIEKTILNYFTPSNDSSEDYGKKSKFKFSCDGLNILMLRSQFQIITPIMCKLGMPESVQYHLAGFENSPSVIKLNGSYSLFSTQIVGENEHKTHDFDIYHKECLNEYSHISNEVVTKLYNQYFSKQPFVQDLSFGWEIEEKKKLLQIAVE
jgi:hypothetical protein